MRTNPEVDLTDVLSQGQIDSKRWLIQELSEYPENLGTIFILGGWYGSLPAMMFEDKWLWFDKIRSFDIDPKCADIADTFNRTWVMDGWRFKASTADMYDLDYNETIYTTYRANGTSCEMTETPDTLINTSCEHIDLIKWWAKIPTGKLVILQSNDFEEGDEHINCVKNIEEFKIQAPMSDILYEGTLSLEKYNRFMLIGLK